MGKRNVALIAAGVLLGVAVLSRKKVLAVWVRERLKSSEGWPYLWGAGEPSTPWEDGPAGVDCSGYAQMALVRLGIMSAEEGDLGAASLAAVSTPIEWGQQRPGDLAFYTGHVEIVRSVPDADGDSETIGSSSGGVSAKSSAVYRADFVGFGRWPG